MSTLMEPTKKEQSLLLRAIQPQKGMKYACVLDEQGNHILSFNKEYLDLNEKRKRKLFMQTVLQTKMAEEFNEDLEKPHCNVVERSDELKYVSVALSSNSIAMAIIKKNYDHEDFVNNVIATRSCLEKQVNV